MTTPSPGLTFVGAAGTVTGSKTIVQADGAVVVVDYGMFQGLKELRLKNWLPFPLEPHQIDAIVLTHGHIDHSGLLPRLVAAGYGGPVHATTASVDLLGILLPDAAYLQEEDARYANKAGFSKHAPALPLFTGADADAALRLLRPHERDGDAAIAPGVRVDFRQAGHILGSSWLRIRVGEGSSEATVVFSGDLGRRDSPIMPPPDPFDGADIVVIESTYGDRDHPPGDARDRLRSVIRDVAKRRSVCIIPAFAIDRTEDLLFLIAELEDAGEIPVLPVWVDSPMASRAYHRYGRYPDELGAALAREVRGGGDPFRTGRLQFTSTVEDSKRLNGLSGPALLISASGMATGGRVLHHLKRRLPDPSATVLFCGYQAEGTRGRSLVDGATSVKIHGEQVPVRARIEQIDGLSAHADRGGLIQWLGAARSAPAMTFLIHGEPDARESLAGSIRRELGWKTMVPDPGNTIPFHALLDGS